MMAGPNRRIAVVLFNLGGPDSLAAVRPFLFNLFRDKAIIGLPAVFRYLVAGLIAVVRGRQAKLNYGEMGGASPLLRETQAQADALRPVLRARFPDAEVKVFIAMRYWRPFTAEVAATVAAFAPDDSGAAAGSTRSTRPPPPASVAGGLGAGLPWVRGIDAGRVLPYPEEAGLVRGPCPPDRGSGYEGGRAARTHPIAVLRPWAAAEAGRRRARSLSVPRSSAHLPGGGGAAWARDGTGGSVSRAGSGR